MEILIQPRSLRLFFSTGTLLLRASACLRHTCCLAGNSGMPCRPVPVHQHYRVDPAVSGRTSVSEEKRLARRSMTNQPSIIMPTRALYLHSLSAIQSAFKTDQGRTLCAGTGQASLLRGLRTGSIWSRPTVRDEFYSVHGLTFGRSTLRPGTARIVTTLHL